MRRFIVVGTLFALITGCFIMSCSDSSKEASGANIRKERAVAVTVAEVIRKEMPLELKTFGNVQAHLSVPIKAEIDGTLMKVHFRKGQNIRKGDLLFSIDSRSSKATLAQAKANLIRDRALAKNAVLNAERSEELLERGLIARSDNDKAQADADALSAAVKADEAAVLNAALQVERCSIRSPISGKAGDQLVSEGTLIKANDSTLVTINQIQPIEVFFSITQAELATVRERMAREKLKVRVGLPQSESRTEEGDLFFVDNAIDQDTGTVNLAAVFRNERELLWPGQYVSVTLTLDVLKEAVVVPSVAVQTGQEGKFAFVVKSDNTVEVRPVIVRMSAGLETVIEKGLQAGERVVTDGQLGLAPGAVIRIRNASQATPYRGNRS